MPAGLLIEVEKGSPKGKDAKSSPMGDDEDLSEFDSALDDAFEAVKSGDKQAFRDAMGAAVSAKCAEMYADEEEM